jgi:hypothetical protein
MMGRIPQQQHEQANLQQQKQERQRHWYKQHQAACVCLFVAHASCPLEEPLS